MLFREVVTDLEAVILLFHPQYLLRVRKVYIYHIKFLDVQPCGLQLKRPLFEGYL